MPRYAALVAAVFVSWTRGALGLSGGVRHQQTGTAQTTIRLGGLGTGWISLRHDGSFGEACLSPLSPIVTDAARGSFVAIAADAGGQRVARVLGAPQFGLPSATPDRVEMGFPVLGATYQDISLPVTVRLEAFSSVRPFDVTSSALPGVVLVFRLRNVVRAPVRASLVLSWRCYLGLGFDGAVATQDALTLHSIPLADGITGLACEGPALRDAPVADMRLHNARGAQCLLAAVPGRRADASSLVWDCSLDSIPWWTAFCSDALLPAGAPVTEAARAPAMAVAVRVDLAPNEEREVAFVLAWYMARMYDADGQCWRPAYTRRYADAERLARDMLEDRKLYQTLAEEWQRSFLGSEEQRSWLAGLSRELEEVCTNALLAFPDTDARRPPRTFRLQSRQGMDATLLRMPERKRLQPCLLALYPELDAADLEYRVATATPGSHEDDLVALVSMVAAHARWLETEGWLRDAWPRIKTLADEIWNSANTPQRAYRQLWQDMLDLATFANDSEYAALCLARARQLPDTSDPGTPLSTWHLWNERLGCHWDRRTGHLAFLSQDPAAGQSLRGPVFGGDYTAFVEYRSSDVGTEFDYRLDRLASAPRGSTKSQRTPPDVGTGQSVRSIACAIAREPDLASVAVTVRGQAVGIADVRRDGRLVHLVLERPVALQAGDRLLVTIKNVSRQQR